MTVHQPSSLFAAAPAAERDARDLLRFITCGSVDDGKSTLIGRLLYDTQHLFEDQLTTLERDSLKLGTQNGALDLALAVDGLAAEREQGITIDVAYRFFATERRSFIVADTPGHEQYTRNMATGASTADLAILLVDARKGLSRQTRRHSLLVAMLGIRHVVLAINKMDLVAWDQATYEAITAEFRDFAAGLGLASIAAVPVSALSGANVTTPSAETPWYEGPTLLGHLETVDVARDAGEGAFRFPVQWVNRPDSTFRGFAGTVSGGSVRPGHRVRVLPSGEETSVARIVTFDGDLAEAVPGQSVTLTLADEVDASRGAVLVAPGEAPILAARFDARLFWMARTPVRDDARYLLKLGTQTVPVRVARVHSRTDLHSLDEETVTALEGNDVGIVTLEADRPVVFDAFARNPETGGLILIDRESYDTVAMGLAIEDGPGGRARAEEAVALAPSLDPSLAAAAGWIGRPLESAWRSAAKTLSWRVWGTLLTIVIAFVLTGDIAVTLAVGAGDLVVKLALFFGHERLWAHIRLGLPSPEEPEAAKR